MTALVPLSAVADVAGVSRRALEIAVANAGVQYQVRVDSLPIALQQRLNASSKAVAAPKSGGALRITVISHLLSRIREHPKGTVARAQAIKAFCETPIVNPETGRVENVSADTVRRWLREEEKHGLAGLARKKRSDHGKKRTIVTTKFDNWARDVGLNDLEVIANAVKDRIRGWHKAWESVSAIRLDANRHLEKLARERGFDPPPDVCDVPMSIVKAESIYRVAAKLRKDRKAFQDDMPGVRRTIVGLDPMDVIVGDVHPLDFFLPEVDGYQRYAKAICWLDVATKRLWVTVVFLRKGEGIRNAHVIASFMEMITALGPATKAASRQRI